MIARLVVMAALSGAPAFALAQTEKGKAGESKLDTAGKPIPKECIGLTGEKRQECIRKHGTPTR